MSIALYLSSLQQECLPIIPAEEPLTGDETLDDFVQKIRLREKSRSKRALFPELAPCSEPEALKTSIWQRVTRTVSILCGRDGRGSARYVTIFWSERC